MNGWRSHVAYFSLANNNSSNLITSIWTSRDKNEPNKSVNKDKKQQNSIILPRKEDAKENNK